MICKSMTIEHKSRTISKSSNVGNMLQKRPPEGPAYVYTMLLKVQGRNNER